jgi:hypothetical protein
MSTPTGQRTPPLRHAMGRHHGANVLVLVLVAAGAATIVVSAVVHLYLWGKSDGYRAVPTVGPLFLIQGIVGCLLGPAMLILRRVISTTACAAYMAMSLGGLYLSLHGGLFGYDETLDSEFVKLTLVVEIIGLVASVLAATITLLPGSARPNTSS